MKKVLFILVLLFTFSLTAQATYKKVGDTLVRVDSLKGTSGAKSYGKTELTLDIKGVTYPVYKSLRGKYFLIRTSKNTGKQYKQYLKIEE